MKIALMICQTNSDVRQSNDKSSDGSSSNFCSETKCQEGSAEFNSSTELCVCPHWTNQDVGSLGPLTFDQKADDNSLEILVVSYNVLRLLKSTSPHPPTSAFARSKISFQS